MTTRDKHIAQKKKQIENIHKQQFRLIEKAADMVAKPSKYHAVNLRRIGKMFAITMQLRALEMQRQMIIAQPIPNFVQGGVVPGRMAIVGETGSELILISNGKIEIK